MNFSVIPTPMIECFFDCSSPWTWLAFRHLQPLAAELGVAVAWKPVLVGGIFNAVNPSVYEFRERGVPAKQAYLKKDLADWARQDGLKILFPPSVFPVNSVKAMRGCLWLDSQNGLRDRFLPFAESVFKAYWSDDQDISQDAVLLGLCRKLGLDEAAFLAGIAQAEIKARLKANTDEVIARGGFGSPTMFVGVDDMYFGNDRLPLLREAVLRRIQRNSECDAVVSLPLQRMMELQAGQDRIGHRLSELVAHFESLEATIAALRTDLLAGGDQTP